MKLNEISPSNGSVKERKRIGRGVGSGNGKTAGKGSKGYNARSGGGVRPGWEGGQMPIHRRLPKRGFNNIFKKRYSIVNLKDLSTFENGSIIDEISLIQKGLIKGKKDGIKILGKGELKQSLTIKNCFFSSKAKDIIESNGGNIQG